jgi:hypothetical protein
MRLSFIIEEVLSPIVTPYVLIFKLRYRAHEIIDFFRQNTTDIQGVGDVCKLAQLDLKQPSSHSDSYDHDSSLRAPSPKTELSLLNFSVRHPNWQPASSEAQQLLERIKNKTRELFPTQNTRSTRLGSSMHGMQSSLSPIGASLMSPQAPMLPTLQETSIQSYTNETQMLMAQSMAAYAELEKGREAVQPLFTSVPNSAGVEIETEQMPMAKSVPNV